METTIDLPIRITAYERGSLDRQLDEAVSVAMVQACHFRQGILVTRHSYETCTVALSDIVPFGLIRERYDW